MAFSKKTWVDRSVEHAGRRTLTAVSGETNVYDVTRNEGTVTAEGDAFNATNMNNLETRIETETNSIRTAMGTQVTYTLSGSTLSITTK